MTNDATVVLAVVIFDMIIVVNKETHKNIKVASSRQFLTALQHDILALVPMTEKVTSQLIDFDRKIITSLHLFRRLLRMYLLIIRDRLLYLEERERKKSLRNSAMYQPFLSILFDLLNQSLNI